MQSFLVGGAVRDRLLGLPVHERDYVVVGGSAEALLAQGYRQVGKDFPVFLHPQTGEEYALARRERKQGQGHGGFSFVFTPEISLEEDLARRDLTINAIAEDAQGRLIDPYGGCADLQARILRHVSPAFVEDPLRVLRVARFAARLAPLGFTIAPATLELMRVICRRGELASLSPERVWQESCKALQQQRPSLYFRTLREVGALQVWFPELDQLFGVAQSALWHPEIDTGEHLMLCLDEAARAQASLAVRTAVLLHDLGKACTPAEILPAHTGHGARGLPLVRAFAERLHLPRAWTELALLVSAEHIHLHRLQADDAATLLRLVMACDGLRRPQRLQDFVLACRIDVRGRLGMQDQAYPQGERLLAAQRFLQTLPPPAALLSSLRGTELAAAIASHRLQALIAYIHQDDPRRGEFTL